MTISQFRNQDVRLGRIFKQQILVMILVLGGGGGGLVGLCSTNIIPQEPTCIMSYFMWKITKLTNNNIVCEQTRYVQLTNNKKQYILDNKYHHNNRYNININASFFLSRQQH
ncbi:hypothetical protein LSH36_160g05056 [Paralvinella palmiformis]|uniref:Transmembrane protein n=1 Tax=Paralvinella palmiformis TaxID=53620 RepID=A0AAD9JVI8_9ANNE|nr:hypothetical protein LSH36_160g05056 [Paralvinella palmiformis]